MHSFSPEELTILSSVAAAAAARYAARWGWIGHEELTQAALTELVTTTGAQAPADRVMARGYLYTVAVRAVRHELTFRRNLTGGPRSRPEPVIAIDDVQIPVRGYVMNRRVDATPGGRKNREKSSGLTPTALDHLAVYQQHDELFSLRAVVQAAVLRVAPRTAVDVLPAVVDVLAGEAEVDEAAQEHGLDALRLSWAVRRVRAQLKQDDEIRRAVGKPTVAEERERAAAQQGAVPA